MTVSLASQASAVEMCRDRVSVIARDRGMGRDAADMLRQQLDAAAATLRAQQRILSDTATKRGAA